MRRGGEGRGGGCEGRRGREGERKGEGRGGEGRGGEGRGGEGRGGEGEEGSGGRRGEGTGRGGDEREEKGRVSVPPSHHQPVLDRLQCTVDEGHSHSQLHLRGRTTH